MDDGSIQVSILRIRHDHGRLDVLANYKTINTPTPSHIVRLAFQYQETCEGFLLEGRDLSFLILVSFFRRDGRDLDYISFMYTSCAWMHCIYLEGMNGMGLECSRINY